MHLLQVMFCSILGVSTSLNIGNKKLKKIKVLHEVIFSFIIQDIKNCHKENFSINDFKKNAAVQI